MRRSSCSKRGSFRVAQDLNRICDQIPVVIKHQNLCSYLRVAKRRAQIICEKFDLFAGGHAHAGIVAGNVERLVLHGDGVDGNARGLVFLHETDEVLSERRIRRRQERALDHRAGGFHPSGRAPGRGHDLQVGVEHKRFSQKRKDVRAIVVDREVLEVGIAGAEGLA